MEIRYLVAVRPKNKPDRDWSVSEAASEAEACSQASNAAAIDGDYFEIEVWQQVTCTELLLKIR